MSKQLRTEATQKAYEEARAQGETSLLFNEEGIAVFDLEQEAYIAEYEYWVIIPNRYPYDAVFATHHMLVPKRAFPYLRDATQEEEAEYYRIKHELDREESYQSIIENFSNSRSVRKHFHAHLVVWLDQVK